MDDHNESNCEGLHEMFRWTTTVLVKTKGAEDLFKWYNKVFKVMNPGSYEDFELKFVTDDEGEYLEITQHNPSFSVDSLICLYQSSAHMTSAEEKGTREWHVN